MKERVYKITEDYCEALTNLCKKYPDSAFRYYNDFIEKLSGVFDLFAGANDMSVEEYVDMYNECGDKLDEVYNKYAE